MDKLEIETFRIKAQATPDPNHPGEVSFHLPRLGDTILFQGSIYKVIKAEHIEFTPTRTSDKYKVIIEIKGTKING